MSKDSLSARAEARQKGEHYHTWTNPKDRKDVSKKHDMAKKMLNKDGSEKPLYTSDTKGRVHRKKLY